MAEHDPNEKRRKVGDVSKGLPEAAPDAVNPYEEDDLATHPEHSTERKVKEAQEKKEHPSHSDIKKSD